MTIEEAPEKMWVFPKADWFNAGASNVRISSAGANDVEYTRSDIAKADWYMRAEIKRLEQVVSSLEVYIMQMEDKIDSLEKSDD
jgi:hypothetical protein